MTLIDKAALLNTIATEVHYDSERPLEMYAKLLSVVNDAPTVDAEPVRHGRWCVTQAYPHTIYCSECFQRFAQAHWAVWEDGSLPRDYCPHCGAKMDGERREDGNNDRN